MWWVKIILKASFGCVLFQIFVAFIYSPDSLAWPAKIYTIWPFLTSPMSSPILCHPHWFSFCSLSMPNEFSDTHTHTHTHFPRFSQNYLFSYCLAVYISSISEKQSLISCLCCMADPLLWIYIFFILRSRYKEQTQLEYAKNSWQREENKQVDTIKLQFSEFLSGAGSL